MEIIPPEQFNTSIGRVSVSHQSFPASINVYTSPKPPKSLRVSKVDLHSISITWVAPKIAKGSTIREFLVKYVVLNNEGNSTITGTEKIPSTQGGSSFLITDLATGTLYGISVAVTTFIMFYSYSHLISRMLILAPSRKTLAINTVVCIFRLIFIPPSWFCDVLLTISYSCTKHLEVPKASFTIVKCFVKKLISRTPLDDFFYNLRETFRVSLLCWCFSEIKKAGKGSQENLPLFSSLSSPTWILLC